MIGNLFSNVLSRKSVEADEAPAGMAAAAVPPAAATEAVAAPAREAEEPRAVEERKYFENKSREHAAADVWLQAQQLLQTLLADPRYSDPKRLERHGWKAYSQNQEDGMIAEIFRRIGARHRTFVEFGCGDGLENNTAYLLAQGWRGLWMDGGDENAKMIEMGFAPLIQHGLLQFRREFITRENVDGLIAAAGLGAEIDLLSIDVDGNDLYLWEAITSVNPRVVVVEYNAKFRPPHSWSVAYNATHQWNGDDYMGASLSALDELARARGYRLVGCDLVGANAFFVRADEAAGHFAEPATPEHLYQPARYPLTYAFPGGHGASSLSIVQGASRAAGLGIDIARQGATYKPHNA